MPFDSPAISVVSTPGGAPRKPDLTLGVFSADGAWKLYSQFDSASTYASRQEAMVAAEARAFAEARAGRRVELLVQEEDGSFGSAPIELH